MTKTFTKLETQGRILGEGTGDAHPLPSPTPWDDLRLSNTTGILPKKKTLCGLLMLK